MSLMACVFALGWPGALNGTGGLVDVLITLGLVALVCRLAVSATRRREKEKEERVVHFRPMR